MLVGMLALAIVLIVLIIWVLRRALTMGSRRKQAATVSSPPQSASHSFTHPPTAEAGEGEGEARTIARIGGWGRLFCNLLLPPLRARSQQHVPLVILCLRQGGDVVIGGGPLLRPLRLLVFRLDAVQHHASDLVTVVVNLVDCQHRPL